MVLRLCSPYRPWNGQHWETGSMGDFSCIESGHQLFVTFLLFLALLYSCKWAMTTGNDGESWRQPSASSVAFSLRKYYTKWNSKQIMLKCCKGLAKSSFRQFLWAFLSFDSCIALLQKSFWCSVKVSIAHGILEGIFVQLLLASPSGRWTSQPAHIPQEASLPDECCYCNSWSQHNSEVMSWIIKKVPTVFANANSGVFCLFLELPVFPDSA